MPQNAPGGTRTIERSYDVRTVERNIRKGVLTRKDVEKHLKALPDVADKAQVASPEDEDDDEDLDDEE